MAVEEQPIDPKRPIIDPHLHLWEILPMPGLPQMPQRFLLPELLATIENSGHNITHSIFVECHQMYRQDGPASLRSLGETEFANGIAAMSASGNYGPCRMAHRIVGSADLRLGAAVRPVLEAHQAAAGERFRGIRMNTAFSEAGLFGFPCDPTIRHMLITPEFQDGARILAEMELSLDIWCLHSQLGEVTALADAVPDLQIILDHVGTPESLGPWAGRKAEARAQWADAIADLARRPNVRVKLGGMGMDIAHPIGARQDNQGSEALAAHWRPYIETCIAAFSPARAMFESNFPPDHAAGSYSATWNAFKIIAAACSEEEKDMLFRRTAANTYHIAIDELR